MKVTGLNLSRQYTGKLSGSCTLQGGPPHHACMARQLTAEELAEIEPVVDRLMSSFIGESIAALTNEQANLVAIEHKESSDA